MTNKLRINSKDYEVGPDIDLDVEEVRRSDGSRLTEKVAEQLGEEIARRGPGRPSLTAPGKHSPHVSFRVQPEVREAAEWMAREEGKTVSEVAREALESYIEDSVDRASVQKRAGRTLDYEKWSEKLDLEEETEREGGEQDVSTGDIHTVKHGDGWANRAEGNKQVSNTAPTKAEAQAKGRDMAINRGVEHLVHNRDGTIGERNTYPRSRDPKSSKG